MSVDPSQLAALAAQGQSPADQPVDPLGQPMPEPPQDAGEPPDVPGAPDEQEPGELPEAPEQGPGEPQADMNVVGAPSTTVDEAAAWCLKAIVKCAQFEVMAEPDKTAHGAGAGAQAFAMAFAQITGMNAKPEPPPPAPAPPPPAEKVPTVPAAIGIAHHAMRDHAQRDPQGFADAIANDPSYLPELLSGAQVHMGELEGSGTPQEPDGGAGAPGGPSAPSGGP